MPNRPSDARGSARRGILIYRPPTLLRVVRPVSRVIGGWTDDDWAPTGRLAALARALDCPSPVAGGTPAEQLAWQLAAQCGEVLSIEWLPERPRVAELLLRTTLKRSGTRLLVPELLTVMELQRWDRESRVDLAELASFFHASLDAPRVYPVDEIDWEAVLREREPDPAHHDYVSRQHLYWIPTYYVGSLSELPDAATAHAVQQLTSVLEAMMRQSPLPVQVALTGSLASFGAPGRTPRCRPPDRADAHVIVGMEHDSSFALDLLHAMPGVKIRLQEHPPGTAAPTGLGSPIDEVRYSRREPPVALARWLAETSEETFAGYRRRLNDWLLELPRLLKLAQLVEHAPDATLRRAAHRSGIELERIGEILRTWSTEGLAKLPAGSVARLFETLEANGGRREKGLPRARLRAEQRMSRIALDEAGEQAGWDESKKSRLWEAARREFAATGSEFRFDLLRREGWIAFNARLHGDR